MLACARPTVIVVPARKPTHMPAYWACIGCFPQIAVALGRSVYLWNAGSGTVDELFTMANEGEQGQDRYGVKQRSRRMEAVKVAWLPWQKHGVKLAALGLALASQSTQRRPVAQSRIVDSRTVKRMAHSSVHVNSSDQCMQVAR